MYKSDNGRSKSRKPLSAIGQVVDLTSQFFKVVTKHNNTVTQQSTQYLKQKKQQFQRSMFHQVSEIENKVREINTNQRSLTKCN